MRRALRSSVTLRTVQGHTVQLVPGDVVGRHWSCALQLRDPRVSEAHAMVSLRKGYLVLLNLRGALLRRGKPCTDPRLVIGDRLFLATDLWLEVADVQVPDHLWVVHSGDEATPIDPAVSLFQDPTRILVGRRADAQHVLWTDGELCFDGERRVNDGDVIVPGVTVGCVPVAAQPAAETLMRRTGPLTVCSHFLTVTISDAQGLAATVTGGPARILHELIEIGGPVAWEVVARELWTDDIDEHGLRRRWDSALVRLRRRLSAAGVRDLVESDGCGHVLIRRRDGDRFEIDD